MGFLHKNINIFLLLLVLFVAVALAASAVYYQNTFKKLTDKYDLTAANLSVCSNNLTSTKAKLDFTLKSLNTTTADIRRYDELYESKSSELEKTSSSLNNTQKQLASETQLKEKYQNDYVLQKKIGDTLSTENTDLKSQRAALSLKITNANSCIDRFKSKYNLTSEMDTYIYGCKQ